jgi:SOS-response transcriptional repressor LexA
MFPTIEKMRDTHLTAAKENAQHALRPTHSGRDNFPMKVGENIRRLRKARGWTILELATRVDSDVGNISRLERGVQGYSDDMLRKIADALECSVADLFSGEVNTEPGPDIQGRVPLISWVQAGVWSEIIDNFSPGDAEEWIPCPVSHSPSTFVLRVRGESMFNPHGRPSFQDGDLIFVDPDRPASHRSLVVVRLDESKEATFKQLIVEGDHKYLKALNPAWPEPLIQINGHATPCGVVIFKGEKL